ncbi:MAG: DUF3488 and transglutaminase-like domain-containing protein [Gammaproteobacteria bacterium]
MADPLVLRLGWMLLALAAAVVPVAMRLPPWITGVFLAAAAWRYMAARRGWDLPGRWLRLALALGLVAGVLYSYRTLNGLEAGSALLVAMGAMKILETRARRDIQVLAFIGYFLVLTQLLYDQPVWSLPWLVLTVAAITLALLQGVRHGPPLSASEGMGLVGRMLAFAVPVALVMWVLFPRVPGPFWALPSTGASGLTGLDDEMSPGTVTRLIQSDEVAFRVSFEGEVPTNALLYWRGPVLERFDGITWRDGERWPLRTPAMRLQGEPVRYRMVIEPNGRPWILALEYPARWGDGDILLTHEFQLVTRQPLENLRAIDLVSFPFAVPETALGEGTRLRLTRLPGGRNPRTVELARELMRTAGSDAAFVNTVLARFRNQDFVYTLQPPPLAGAHPVDEFLFRTRRGFCEHYASAFTVLARAAGIPARVVTGYQGGELNPVSNRVVVRQSDAHAWSEVWLDGQGWTRVDATGAVAPNRVELGIAEALPAGEALPGAVLRGVPLLERLRQNWDALNTLWTDWVLGYGPERQRAFLDWMGLPGADWRALVLGLTLFVAAVMASLAAWLAWQSRGPGADPALRAYRRFCAKLAAAGLTRGPAEGPRDFAGRVAAARPELAVAVAGITDEYLALRYGPEPDPARLRVLRQSVSSFRP